MSGPRPAWIDQRLYPFEDRWAEIDGNEIHYIDEGTGPVLLFIHGNPCWSFLYRDVVIQLREHFRCIAPDLPGFGLSEPGPRFGFRPEDHAAALSAFVEHVDLRDATAVLHDWGGPIGLWTAGRHPERFTRLVLSETFGWPMDDPGPLTSILRLLGTSPGRRLLRHPSTATGFMRLTSRHRPTDAEITHYRSPMRRPGGSLAPSVLPSAVVTASNFLRDVERDLNDLRHLPTLLLWPGPARGGRDAGMSRRGRQRFERVLDKTSTVIVPRAGHYLPQEDPQAFATAILNWMVTTDHDEDPSDTH